MRTIMVMFDSLNRHMLPNYGCDWVHAPNFKRLAERTVTFDNAYVGSMPCMPARRDMMTGRYNFLHRSWGPIEPYDKCMPELLKQNGVYTHLISDHQHYWEDGGATYHTRYSSWEISRGQEGDPWKGEVGEQDFPDADGLLMRHPAYRNMFRQDIVNRKYMQDERDHPQATTFRNGLSFIEQNQSEDKWFLQIETFDPHEPFFAYQQYKDMYPHDYSGKPFDWPPYYYVQESEETVQHGKYQYAALLSMCDHYLGQVLDMMDRHDMWKDTMLIVNTDHGYMLGEHGWWAKSVMPIYQEIAHIPMFIWDPRSGVKDERRQSLVQNIDMCPTLLDFFEVPIPEGLDGRPLRDTIEFDSPVRQTALFGYHGGHINMTDGRYVYMKGPSKPDNSPLYEYTLMPTHMRQLFSPEELQHIELQEPFSFTQGCRTMKIGARTGVQSIQPFQYGSKLFDIAIDPHQIGEIEDIEVELRLIKLMTAMMRSNDAPQEQYVRMGLPPDGVMSAEQLRKLKDQVKEMERLPVLQDRVWSREAQNQMRALLNLIPTEQREQTLEAFREYTEGRSADVTEETVLSFVEMTIPPNQQEMALYFIRLAGRTH
jgi:arylsulfatase A-like enzyme